MLEHPPTLTLCRRISMNIYLYVKQCSHCDLKYFGKTEQDNPYVYGGSGVYWKSHLSKHNAKHITLETFHFTNQHEATEFALKFSKENNIVESDLWANLREENGLDGGNTAKFIDYEKGVLTKIQKNTTGKGIAKSKEHKENLRRKALEQKSNPSYIEKFNIGMSKRILPPQTQEDIQASRERMIEYNKSENHRVSVSNRMKDVPKSEDQKKKQSDSMSGRRALYKDGIRKMAKPNTEKWNTLIDAGYTT